MKPNRILAALCVWGIVSSALHAAEPSFAIKFNRPVRVGQKTHDVLKATVKKSHRITQGGKTHKEEAIEFRAELSGVSEVREVTAEGKTRRLVFTVETFSLSEGGKPAVQPFKKGTVIDATGVADRKKKFEVAGKEVTGPAAKALSECFSLSGPNKKEMNEDEVFGSAQKRPPGSEWDINAKALVEFFPAEVPFVLKADEVSGKVKFTGIGEHGGVSCCELKMEITMKPASFKGMPDGFKLSKADIGSSAEKMLPVDAASLIPEEKVDQRVDFTGTIPTSDGPVNIEFVNRSSKERLSRPVK